MNDCAATEPQFFPSPRTSSGSKDSKAVSLNLEFRVLGCRGLGFKGLGVEGFGVSGMCKRAWGPGEEERPEILQPEPHNSTF